MLIIVYLIFILRDIFFYCFQHIIPVHALYLISNNVEESGRAVSCTLRLLYI
jgi:hypothetical protein